MNNKSLDDMNIWWLHERNSRYYHTCKDLSKCPSKFSKDDDSAECLCHHNQIVTPQEIGEWWQPVTLKTRSYIRIGSKCSICLCSIIHKRNAWITYCGHSFHRTCLMQSYEVYMKNPNICHYTNVMPCPICRSELPTCCCGYITDRYHTIYEDKPNYLDKLENFEILKDLSTPIECYKCPKYIGMNNNCDECKDYQKNGHSWLK